jgi:E3 ubiquitin-protein ligase BRE1
LSEEDVTSCDVYRNLKLKLEDIVARYNHIEAMNKSLREETAKLQAERKTYKDTLENEHQVLLMELQSQLTRAEHDVARIRTARDQFQEELIQRKNGEEPSLYSSKEIKDLAEVRQTRIESLEAEIARLRIQLEEGKVAVSEDVRSLSHEQLAEKYEKLDRAFKDLSQELAPLETAYKRAHELSTRKVMGLADRDEKIAKLSAEVFPGLKAYDLTLTIGAENESGH